MDYQKQVNDFLTKTSTTVSKEFVEYGYHFDGDKQKRNIRKVMMKNARGKYEFRYGDSIVNSNRVVAKEYPNKMLSLILKNIERKVNAQDKINIFACTDAERDYYFSLSTYTTPKREHFDMKEPDNYSILACLNIFYWDSFDDFCSEYGYDNDSRSAMRIYKEVVKEDRALRKMFTTEELDELQEIR